MSEEIAAPIVVIAILGLAFFAKSVSGGSRGKGALIVLAVVLPLVILFDLLEGSGLEPWILMPVGLALLTYLLVSFIGGSGSGGYGGGGWGGGGDEGDGGDGGGGE